MYWNEKIDLVKKKFQTKDFKDPFQTGKEIIEKIIVRFHKSTWQGFINSENRASLIKQAVLIKSCTVKELYAYELPKLNKNINFWVLLINIPMDSGFRIYDCKYEPLREILYLSSGQTEQEFYIIEKKYSWLLYFKIDHKKNMVEIYKS